jgi:hypothetical protein
MSQHVSHGYSVAGGSGDTRVKPRILEERFQEDFHPFVLLNLIVILSYDGSSNFILADSIV